MESSDGGSVPHRAAIDIGSNSILLTLLDDEDVVVHDEARVVGLGRGLGDRGVFAPDRMSAAMEVLTSYVAIARAHKVEPWSIKAVATSAARRAMNADTFFERILKRLGLRIRIISGDEEARITWLGSLRDLPAAAGPVLVVDLGGGSTELVLGQGETVIERASLEIGSTRLTERFLEMDPQGIVAPPSLAALVDYVDVELSRFSFGTRPWSIVGVAGTVTTLAAMQLGLETYDADRVHGSRLDRAHLSGFIDGWLPTDRETRARRAAVAPDRAEALLAGAQVVDRVLAAARCESLVVSDRGLRYGLLPERK